MDKIMTEYSSMISVWPAHNDLFIVSNDDGLDSMSMSVDLVGTNVFII